jgi:hypothetical protein
MALKPLTLEQLISAPLRALVLGQEGATHATAEVISRLGFESTPEGKVPSARMLEFEYSHPVPDPANPGSTIETPTRLRVPLLTLLPVPNLRISEANVTFGANVVDVQTERTPTRAVAIGSGAAGKDYPATQISATYAPSVAPPGAPPPTLTISIKVIREQPTEGLARILSVLGDAITSGPAKGR